MATKVDIETDLTLELAGTRVTAAKFRKAVSAFLGLIDEVTKTKSGNQNAPDWLVQVKRGSNLIGASPSPGYSPAIAQAVYEELGKIHAITEDDSHGYSETALKYIRQLASITTEDSTESFVKIWVKKSPTMLGQTMVTKLASILESGYEDYGSIDGKLQLVSEKGGYRAEITEALSEAGIRCHLNKDRMQEALQLFGKRVEAYGEIKYRKSGEIISIVVDEFVKFPDPNKIPTFEQVRGILKDTL